MLHGFVPATGGPERMGLAQAGTQVGLGFEEAPEEAGMAPKGFWPECPLAGGDSLLVQLQGFLAAASMFGQEGVGVGTVGAEFEGFCRKLDPALLVPLLERPVDEYLGLGQGR